MGVSNLRQSNRVGNNGERIISSLETAQITINSIRERHASPFCEDYPFEDQPIYSGNLVYHEESEFGGSRDIECTYQYRTGSGLFVLQSEVDLPLERVIQEINSVAPDNFHIYRNLSPKRESLWEFISSSDRVIEISFLNELGEEADVEEFEDMDLAEVANNYPIDTATAVYEHNGRQILVRYTGGSIVVDTDDPDANEYIIQLFERDVIQSID
jgi:hypothetical protein